MEKIMNYSKIPSTDSIEELAQFWDTHDLTDFEDQLEEVKDQVFERETLISIRLELQEVETVKKIAKSQGLDYHDLIREWVLEKVSQF
jgi:predicted DNA binding CopG/RHH family protein